MIFLCKFLGYFRLSFLTVSKRGLRRSWNITYETDFRHLNNHACERWMKFCMLFLANLRSPEAEPEEESPKDNVTNSGGNNYCSNTSISHSIFQTLKNEDVPSGGFGYVCSKTTGRICCTSNLKEFRICWPESIFSMLVCRQNLVYFVVFCNCHLHVALFTLQNRFDPDTRMRLVRVVFIQCCFCNIFLMLCSWSTVESKARSY